MAAGHLAAPALVLHDPRANLRIRCRPRDEPALEQIVEKILEPVGEFALAPAGIDPADPVENLPDGDGSDAPPLVGDGIEKGGDLRVGRGRILSATAFASNQPCRPNRHVFFAAGSDSGGQPGRTAGECSTPCSSPKFRANASDVSAGVRALRAFRGSGGAPVLPSTPRPARSRTAVGTGLRDRCRGRRCSCACRRLRFDDGHGAIEFAPAPPERRPPGRDRRPGRYR